jgi:hypothetical protein
LLLLLRILTLTAGVLLVIGLLAWDALQRRALARAASAAWLCITGVQCTLLVNNVVAELFTVARQWLDSALIRELGKRFYYSAYLTNGILDALLPAVLLALSLRAGWIRKGSLLLSLGILAVGAVGIRSGALRDWETLLTATQTVSFLGIAGYLTYCGLFILKRLPQRDPYLAGFVAVTAIFNLVLPIQEAIFQAVGQGAAAEIWHVTQLLQLADLSAKLMIVLACIKNVRQGMAPSAAYPVPRP